MDPVLYRLLTQGLPEGGSPDTWDIVLGPLGALALSLIFLFVIVVRGTLVPRGSHKEIISVWKERFEQVEEDRNYWRAAYERQVELSNKAVELAEAKLRKAQGM